MSFASTVITASDPGTAILSSATTWANTKGASLYDPVVLTLKNHSTATNAAINASSASTVGLLVGPEQTLDVTFTKEGDALFVFTTGVDLGVIANNQ